MEGIVSITDELLEWWVRKFPVMDKKLHEEFAAIANRIDVAHRAALEKLAAQLDDTSEMREFCERLEEAAKGHEDVQLWGVDYTPTEGAKDFADNVPAMFVQCPVDADGLPIHVGDVMEWPTTGETFEVAGIGGFNGNTLFYINEESDTCEWTCAWDKRHHAKTVEDVLREFAFHVCDSSHQWGLDAAGTIAEYAKRLRLAEEDK